MLLALVVMITLLVEVIYVLLNRLCACGTMYVSRAGSLGCTSALRKNNRKKERDIVQQTSSSASIASLLPPVSSLHDVMGLMLSLHTPTHCRLPLRPTRCPPATKKLSSEGAGTSRLPDADKACDASQVVYTGRHECYSMG